ncbi:MAG TPA: dienelactone hydrolase family protein [Terriglobales bacterium]|nr:dienelactone hydrolase family protein [Terriglobales bacterium]
MEQVIIRVKVELDVSDGTKMGAYVARPEGEGPHAAVIVLQEAFGVNSHIRDVTDRFAREGYVAIAPELFHRTASGFEGDYADFASTQPHMKAMTMEGAEADLHSAHAWMESRKDVKAKDIYSVGFCLGGKISFLANTVLPLRASSSFYGGGIAQSLLDRAPAVKSPMLLVWGGLDKHILPEHRKAVTDALLSNGKEYVNIEFSNADHAFFCDERQNYHPQAAEQAWVLLLEFFRSE